MGISYVKTLHSFYLNTLGGVPSDAIRAHFDNNTIFFWVFGTFGNVPIAVYQNCRVTELTHEPLTCLLEFNRLGKFFIHQQFSQLRSLEFFTFRVLYVLEVIASDHVKQGWFMWTFTDTYSEKSHPLLWPYEMLIIRYYFLFTSVNRHLSI